MRPDQMPRQPFPSDQDLVGLPEDVQKALGVMDGSADGNQDDAYDVIVAELLRLARENAELREDRDSHQRAALHAGLEIVSIRDAMDDEMLSTRDMPARIRELSKAEAELAALKRRIAEAFVVDLHRGCYSWYEMYDPATQDLADIPETLKDERVALLPVGGE